MIMKPDYYKILDLKPGATTSEIKKSYRKLALKYHPDRNPSNEEAEEQFKWVSEAYQTLNDPEKRSQYDQVFFFRHADVLREFKRNEEKFFYAPAHDLLGDFFRGFFSGPEGRAQPKKRRGEDLRYNLKVSFVDAARGTDVEIKVPYHKECTACHGTGAKPGGGAAVCKICQGRGKVKSRNGSLEFFKVCHSCRGRGAIISSPCLKCNGAGTVQAQRSHTVSVPAGVETGTRLRVRGQGATGYYGGQAGDLIVVIQVENHPVLERERGNLRCEVPVPIFRAILGGKIEIPTLGGIKVIKIPPGSASGTQIRLSGEGIPSSHQGKRGDLVITLKVEMPRKLYKKQKDTLNEWCQLDALKAYPHCAKFMQQARDSAGAKKK
jgi:molecular chaperone DnaJ